MRDIGTTISGMTGRGSIRHNNREFTAANVDRERSAQNVVFVNENLKQVYHELFDEALETYNAGKKKTRDKIPDYYKHIQQSKQEKLFHEAIFQIGNLNDCGCGSEGGQRAAEALTEFAKTFQARNPHLRVFNMSVEDINRFTKDDVVCALEMFNEDYVTFPRDDIAKISGMTMPVNKRNWRKQKDHLGRARAVQNFDDPDGKWRNKKGQPKAQNKVYEWRQQHPEGRKADCHRDTGLDPKTIRKWWDSEPPAVWQEDGHMVARVRPSQALSDLLVESMKKDRD